MTQKRRNFSGTEKVAILRLHLLEHKPVADICDQFDIRPTQFYRWQKEFFDHGAAAFDTGGKTRKNHKHDQNKKIAALEHKLQQKNEVVAELMQEYIQLKKEFGEL